MFDDNISPVYGGIGDLGAVRRAGHAAETLFNNAILNAQTDIAVGEENVRNQLALAQLKLDLQGGNEHPASSWISSIGGAIDDNIDFGEEKDDSQGDLVGNTMELLNSADGFMVDDFSQPGDGWLSGLSPVDFSGPQGIGGAAGRFAGQLFN